MLAPVFSQLPKPVLAALIIDAVLMGMIETSRVAPPTSSQAVRLLLAVAAIIGVLSVGVLAGVVIGVALSLGWLVYVTTAPPIHLLAREPDTGGVQGVG